MDNRYKVYKSVPGIEQFLDAYKEVSFGALWAEYDAFLKKTFGGLCTPLLPGNETEQVLSVFRFYEAEPIEDFLFLYTLCNGNDEEAWLEGVEQEGAAYGHIGGNPLINLSEMMREVKNAGRNVEGRYPIQSVPEGFVKNNEMLSNKIPIHHDGGGNFIAIDLDPDTKGQYGQIVEVDHEYDERVVLAASLKEYITILYYFVKELGVIDNGEGFEGERPLSSYVVRR
ncbi:SMI1/KNR4 family protein [Domibacillus indicus]|uniref:SMI1/KNR4 family protein n=1 Tax=Domibacillus indicus TaxID=1437523 RepID=UPI000617E442|nr:SMI1/KNR4 family protein [Domibacillus indicus]